MNHGKHAALYALIALLGLCMFVACGGTDTDPADTAIDTAVGSAADTADTTAETAPESEPVVITIAEALELCGESGNLTAERYYIRGTIVSVTDAQYGAMVIEDATGTISVYGTYSADGSIGYADMQDKPYKGDIVLLYCTLQNYNGQKEVKNARLISFERVETEVDESAYTDMSIAEAREAAEGAKIKVDGVVARITYANGLKAAGLYLVDNTQSIYVYDADLAQRVSVGDTVTILASKTYWILDSEKNNAEKFGYKGCCQLENAVLIKQDATGADFDKTWIPTSTVKDILETPVTENITASIFKVTALVSRQDGNGFINYYFYDLDGKTGTYTYTQCNGSDFAWLDAFDGKLCTVYLSALNAKSTNTDCYFRFVPVAVVDEQFTFDTANAGEHAVVYYGLPQFNATYTGDPAAELITEVSSELLGFEKATLRYTSSDESVIRFDTADGKTVFHCVGTGKATVTVTGSYNGTDYSDTVEISVTVNQSYDTVSVADAIAADVGTSVTLKGIVGPSLVNKSGFYLFDGTGMIAIEVNDTAVFNEIEIGHEIVLSGVRQCSKKKVDQPHAGQICIREAEVLANYYGEHDYPSDGFITGKTLADLRVLNANEDHSTEVYIVQATVSVVETPYYTTIKLMDGEIELSLYCSSAAQYSFLKDFAGREVTMEIAPCNWNDKTYYAGCVLAVYTEDGKICNTLNFNN